MADKKFIITIGREYGSGGRTVGKKLAEELGVHFYDDDEILKLTSERSAIGEQYFRLADEKAGNNLFYKLFDSMKPELGEPRVGEKMTTPENLFRFQAKLIREIADKEESCIIAGRAADFILEEEHRDELIKIFVFAPFETKIKNSMKVYGIDRMEAEKRVRKINKEREGFYYYYTGKNWMDMNNYDVAINSEKINFDQVAEIIKGVMKARGFEV